MKGSEEMGISNEQLIALLRGMMRIRCLEETVADRYKEQEMQTPTHFSIRQEATAGGVCAVLEQQHVVYSGERCHAQYQAEGGPVLGLVGELSGKEIGWGKRRGGAG